MEPMNIDNPPVRQTIYQIWASFITHSLTIHAGVNLAFATILLPQLVIVDEISIGNGTDISISFINETVLSRNITSDLHISKEEASWVASIVAVMTPVGSIASGLMMDRWGRKKICMLTAVTLTAAWCLTASTTTHISFLYLSRSLSGVGAGLSTAATVYISEITHSSVRPILLATLSGFVSFGILLATLLGFCLPWRGVAIACAVLAAANFFAIFTIPESPIWLSRHNCDEEIIDRSVRFLNRNDQLYNREMLRLQKKDATPLLESEKSSSRPRRKSGGIRASTWKPLTLLTVLFTFQQLTGGYVVIFYAIQIFELAGSVAVDGWITLILLGAIRFLMSIVAVFLVVGRKTLLLVSGMGMCVSILTAGLLLHFQPPSLIPVFFVLVYVTFSSVGFLNIPWTLNGELLPNRIRGSGSGAMVSYAYFVMFLTVKSYITVEDAVGIPNIFIFFSVISLFAVIFVHFFIPETFGKTFEEIEKQF